MKQIIVIFTMFLFFSLTAAGGWAQTDAGYTKIRLNFNNEEVLVYMYDNPASRDFIAMLPLTLTFEDYAGTEKISYMERKLNANDAPDGFEPVAGDFTYYVPWGNLAIFYRDFRYSNNLIRLGQIEQGVDKLKNVQGSFTVVIEIVE